MTWMPVTVTPAGCAGNVQDRSTEMSDAFDTERFVTGFGARLAVVVTADTASVSAFPALVTSRMRKL